MRIANVTLLNKEGEIVNIFKKNDRSVLDSAITLPVLIDYYLWDNNKQEASAEKYKDQIKRVFYQDDVDEKTKNMLQDDIQRLNLIQTFEYGRRVLEVGCSDGSASIKIAHQPKVKEVIGIDIRKSAISDGKKLIKDLIKTKEIDKKTANKISLLNYSTALFPKKYGVFDSVCAYEIFEHLAPQDMLPVFQNLYKFIDKKGKFYVSVPNRFPSDKYEKLGRSRWKWFDHRNFFSKLSLEMFLSDFFESVKFYPLYKNEKIEDSLYLICECKGKKYEA